MRPTPAGWPLAGSCHDGSLRVKLLQVGAPGPYLLLRLRLNVERGHGTDGDGHHGDRESLRWPAEDLGWSGLGDLGTYCIPGRVVTVMARLQGIVLIPGPCLDRRQNSGHFICRCLHNSHAMGRGSMPE